MTKIRFPGRSNQPRNSYKVIAGSYLSVNVIAGNVSSSGLERLEARLAENKTILESNDQTQIDALTRDDVLGDIFYAGSLGYYAKLQVLSELSGLTHRAYQNLSAGFGTIGYEPSVNYFLAFHERFTMVVSHMIFLTSQPLQ